MDADDLVCIRVACTKLHNKAGIFYTKFRIWDPYYEAFIALRSVCLKWFSADYQSNFSDTRI